MAVSAPHPVQFPTGLPEPIVAGHLCPRRSRRHWHIQLSPMADHRHLDFTWNEPKIPPWCIQQRPQEASRLKNPQILNISSYRDAVGIGTLDTAAAQAASCPFLQFYCAALGSPTASHCPCVGSFHSGGCPAVPSSQHPLCCLHNTSWKKEKGNEWERTTCNSCIFALH